MSWLLILSVVTRFGFSPLLVRNVARFIQGNNVHQMSSLLTSAFRVTGILCLFFGLLVTGLSIVNANVFGIYTPAMRVAVIGVLPFVSFAYLFQSVLVGMRKVALSDIPILVVRNVSMIAVVLCASIIFGAELAAIDVLQIVVVVYLLVFIISLYWIKINMAGKILVKSNIIIDKKWASVSRPFFYISSSQWINQRADIIILGFFTSPGQIAIYAAVSRLIPLIGFFPSIINNVIKPYISSYFIKKRIEGVRRIVFFAAIITFISSTGFSVGLAVFGKWILTLFGDSFKDGYPIMLILIFSKLISILTGPVGVLLNMTNQATLSSKIEMYSSATFILLCYMLVPTYGVYGAAIATAMAWIGRNVIMTYFVFTRLNVNPTIVNFSGLRYLKNRLKVNI